MKVFLIAPSTSYSIGKVLKTGLTELGHEVFEADFEKYMSRFLNRFQTQAFRLPFKLRNIWEDYYSNEINKFFVTEYDRIKPDLVFVYNDSKLISDTVKYFQKKTKVVFYLGDNPFYTWTKVNFLNLIMDADFIFAPDTMWVEQLRMLGIKNIEFEVLGSDPKTYFPIKPSEEDLNKYSSDIVFIGNSYFLNWGYKRALFLSKFSMYDLKIYGTKHWLRWLKFYPQLKDKFVLLTKPVEPEKVNLICNCCKIYPVDANPGLLHGIHARVFDCIASGILPIVEYREDLKKIFNDIEIPVIKNYNEIKEITEYYLKAESERKNLIISLQKFLNERYSSSLSLTRMLSKVNIEG